MTHRLGITLTQITVADKTNDIGAMMDLLSKLIGEGNVFATGTHCTHGELAREILDQGGHCLFVVKRHQFQLHEDMESLFEEPLPLLEGKTWPTAQTVDAAHGHTELGRLQATTMLNDCVNWPDVNPVPQLRRQVVDKKTG